MNPRFGRLHMKGTSMLVAVVGNTFNAFGFDDPAYIPQSSCWGEKLLDTEYLLPIGSLLN